MREGKKKTNILERQRLIPCSKKLLLLHDMSYKYVRFTWASCKNLHTRSRSAYRPRIQYIHTISFSHFKFEPGNFTSWSKMIISIALIVLSPMLILMRKSTSSSSNVAEGVCSSCLCQARQQRRRSLSTQQQRRRQQPQKKRKKNTKTQCRKHLKYCTENIHYLHKGRKKEKKYLCIIWQAHASRICMCTLGRRSIAHETQKTMETWQPLIAQ